MTLRTFSVVATSLLVSLSLTHAAPALAMSSFGSSSAPVSETGSTPGTNAAGAERLAEAARAAFDVPAISVDQPEADLLAEELANNEYFFGFNVDSRDFWGEGKEGFRFHYTELEKAIAQFNTLPDLGQSFTAVATSWDDDFYYLALFRRSAE